MNYDNTEINSPYRYAGGKFYARKILLEIIPPHNSYVEPFAGGASVFFAKNKVDFNWLNDRDEELINCLLHIRDYCEDLIDFLGGLPASKELHSYFKNEYQPSNDLERAGRWYYLNRTSYSGIMKMENCYWGYGDKYSMRPENWPRHLRKCSSKLQGVRITSLDYKEVIEATPEGSFLFLDPPYFNRDQDKFYTHTFTEKDHYELAEILHNNRDRFNYLLTYDDCPEIRRIYNWAYIAGKEWYYTINRTDDQTGATNSKGKRYKGRELLITNYDQEHIKQLSIYELIKKQMR